VRLWVHRRDQFGFVQSAKAILTVAALARN
jgi:hypothetical protein